MPGAGRNKIDYTDERITSQTFYADGTTLTYDSTQANGIPAAITGRAVTYAASGDDTISLAADGDAIVGKLLKIAADLACTVQIVGYTTLGAGAGATVTRGRKQVGALGGAGGTLRGYIRDVAAATTAEQAKTGPFAVANGDLNNVVVDFRG